MANRGIVIYNEPPDVNAGQTIQATPTSYLLSVLLTTMNEWDSDQLIASNPDDHTAPVYQLSGITDQNALSEMNSVRASIGVYVPVYAAYINTIINYTNEMVSNTGASASSISNVNVGDLIMASTFISITTNLRAVSAALNNYASWWNSTTGYCARSCQVSCQAACQLSCQSCYGGTCHNQNCGGFS